MAGYAENTKRSKQLQALRMMTLLGPCNIAGWICRKHEKIEKVTSSQDDDFGGVLKKNILNKLPRSWDAVLGTPIQLTEFRRDG